jgi:two-component system response regulator PilR (NtrC family)
MLSTEAQAILSQYHFPGNVRELQNTLERALTLCESEVILPEHLQLQLSDQPKRFTSTGAEARDFPILQLDHPAIGGHDAGQTLPNPAPEETLQADTSLSLPAEGLELYLQNLEKQMILKALEQSHWNRTAAAKKLGMSFRSLRYRLKKLGLGEDDDTTDDSP